MLRGVPASLTPLRLLPYSQIESNVTSPSVPPRAALARFMSKLRVVAANKRLYKFAASIPCARQETFSDKAPQTKLGDNKALSPRAEFSECGGADTVIQ